MIIARLLFPAIFVSVALCPLIVAAEIPTLPDGGQTSWLVDGAEEIVVYTTFDPELVQDRLPPNLQFVRIGELAVNGISWANAYLKEHPLHEDWGISFLEIVRMETFLIDDVAPVWPKDGAAALWFARVRPLDPDTDIGPGSPFLMLNFWMPDSEYVLYMREKGYYSTYGDVRLFRSAEGKWHGSVQTEALKIVAECLPEGDIRGGDQSAGMQVLIPPATSTVSGIIRVAFAGHRVQDCTLDTTWISEGAHPLSRSVALEPASFQFGYRLNGSVYFDKTVGEASPPSNEPNQVQ